MEGYGCAEAVQGPKGLKGPTRPVDGNSGDTILNSGIEERRDTVAPELSMVSPEFPDSMVTSSRRMILTPAPSQINGNCPPLSPVIDGASSCVFGQTPHVLVHQNSRPPARLLPTSFMALPVDGPAFAVLAAQEIVTLGAVCDAAVGGVVVEFLADAVGHQAEEHHLD